MNKILFLNFSLIALITLSTSCNKIKPEGEIISKEISIPLNVNDIRIGSGIELTLDESLADNKIEIITHENIHDYIKTEINNNYIDIYIHLNKPHNNFNIKAKASKNQYEKFTASGGSAIYCYAPIIKDKG